MKQPTALGYYWPYENLLHILLEFLETLRSLFEGLYVLAECKPGIGFTYVGMLFAVELGDIIRY